MPQGENFWNPYRWVTVSKQPVQYDVPSYHHTLDGLSGRLWCELEALTPLMIGDGRGEFVKHRLGSRPYIPATSLKGAIRSLAEVISNAAVPFPNASVDAQHTLEKAYKDSQFDTVARTFGFLHKGNVFAGLIRFSDAELTSTAREPHLWSMYDIVVGQPKRSHGTFYPESNQRKFYHHHPGATRLIKPPPDIKQTTKVKPAPPGTCFRFTVNFTNLRDAELNLLLYCLVLEESVAVTLSQAALGRDATQEPVTLRGPLRHKIGGAKPHGAGSVHIRVTKMQLQTDALTRYRGNDTADTWETTEELSRELDRRTTSFLGRTDPTMRELRAMLVYSLDDPRKPIHYPTYQWFKSAGNSAKPLKPTI